MFVSDKCDRAICLFYYFCVLLCAFLNINVFCCFTKKICLRKMKFGRKFFKHTSIYCHACQKVCHLPSSAALLHKLTSDDDFD